jgi:aminopeptidase C
MSTTITKKRNIRYLNRDFDSFKRDLIEHLRIYFPDTVSDFNESNAGILLTELVSFIGDNLSFYLDK